ncbi:ankyrin repeat domain-containing protein 50-like isoform X1 [Haliotis rufescens]|uniref:ankyrin repeat domain-containing protein 50-like isoform X1 n=2 Tax=Haliotis rufescens TaxID=6454 RepID=UPI001EAFD204|nr:ankyrin repeat domain-containing protein 50-like isoform X1 [Haliotis rufescens]
MSSAPCSINMTQSLLQGKRFFCREWAFSKVNHCVEHRPSSKTCGALIMGGPGCGKTALCCELVWPTVVQGKQATLNKRLLAYHFCQANDIETLSLVNFIRNLVDQLSKSDLLIGYREKIQEPSIQRLLEPSECERDPDEAFKQAVLHPLCAIDPPKSTLFMIVDSIDESYLQTINDRVNCSRTLAELLANHHPLFPEWLLLVCSSRKQSKSVTRMFTGFRKISLDDLRKSHIVRDVQQYILCRLDQEEALRQHLSKETAEMLNQLHIKSNGCFLYLEKVLDGVAENFIMLREIREIPGTLNGLYLWLSQRLFVRKQFAKIQPILNAILASRRPMTQDELFSCAQACSGSLSREEFDRRLRLMSKILIDGKEGTKILFHHSFAEWLLDVKHCTQKYLCNASEGHGMLAMHATRNAPNLTPAEVQDFALHLVRTNFQAPIQHYHIVQWLLLSGANVEDSLSVGLPKDQKVLKLLLDAGAKMPSNEVRPSGITEPSAKDESESVKDLQDIDIPLDQVDSNGRTLLHTAAHQGNLQVVNLLLTKGANIEAIDKTGQTPLNLAARQGYAEVVEVLLKAKAEVDHADNDGWTALRSAAWGGHTAVVGILLKAGAKVDHADSDQRTALRAAAWGGHEDIVLKLLEHGANVNKADNEGRTALIAAAYMGHVEIVQHLLDYQADINHEDCDGRTALSVAALCIPASEGHEKVVSSLLERGAEVDHQDHDGMTPLVVAAYEGHSDVCELLLEWDADVDHSDHNNRTALWAAASMGHAKVVAQLLFWGAAVDHIDAEGRTVLCVAAAQGSVAVVQQLLDRGLDEMHRDNSGWTPLHMAAYEGHTEVCQIIIEQGAKINEIDNDGRTPLIHAAQEGHAPVVACLLEHHAHIDHRSHDGKTALRVAALEGHRDVLEILVTEGGNINYKDADGRSTLYVLALENQFNMAQYLLEVGADVESVDLEGRTALHVAAWQGHFEMAELLIMHEADVNAVDNDQRTSLQSAAWQGHEKVVRLLLEKGAHVDHTCNQGATALCIAAQEGHEEVVRVLLKYHANPNHADQFGRTPIRVAMKSGHTSVCKILEDFGAMPVNGTKSRSSSSTSSNETRPLTTNPPKGGAIAGHPHPIHSSPSDSPESTFDRRKSYHSNNSSKSSSNLTSSTNQSSQSGNVTKADGECLTFTQQLQQCSMGKNRSRPISRVLSPVSEPQSPVQSPPTSPVGETPKFPTSGGPVSPSLEHNINILNPSPVKSASLKQEKISATINIITNPNAEIMNSCDEPVWQLNPAHFQNMKRNLLQQRGIVPDSPTKMVMGQSALHMRSPEMRRKRNGIVTNPNITKSPAAVTGQEILKSPGVNGHGQSTYNKLSSDTKEPVSPIHANGFSSIPSGSSRKGPQRPNGLSLKKETPLRP